MILAAGLTPAWQQTVLLDRLSPGEVNRALSFHSCASGKVINAGIALHRLGALSRTIAPCGGIYGRALQDDLLALSVRWVESSAATRVCTTLLDRSSGTATEIVENAPPLSESDRRHYAAAFAEEAARASLCIFTGSLPSETPASFVRDLARGFKGRLLLDIRGAELNEAMALRPWLVKPNREELESTLASKFSNEAELLSGMRVLQQRGAENVVVTNGPHPVLAVFGNEAWRAIPPRVKVVNPIGCGDCFAAGLAYAASQSAAPPEALRQAVATAAANSLELLPGRFDPAQASRLLAEVRIEKVD